MVIVANEGEERKWDESCGELVGKGMGFDVQLKSDVLLGCDEGWRVNCS